MQILLKLSLLVLLLCELQSTSAEGDKWSFLASEDELYHQLLLRTQHDNKSYHYNKHTRPVHSATEQVEVRVGFSVLKIVDLDLATEIFTVDVILVMLWKDFRLAWNRTDYDIDRIRLPWQEIWRPDLTLYNSAEPNMVPPESQHAIAFPDGTVVWAPKYVLKTHCSSTLFKTLQTCKLYFGSWTHDISKMRFKFVRKENPVDMTFTTEDNTWLVLQSSANIDSITFRGSAWAAELVTVNLTLERRTDFLNIGPIQLSKIVTFLVPLIFLVPHTSCHNVLLGSAILICNGLAMVVNQINLPHLNYPSIVPALQVKTSAAFTVVALFISVLLQRLALEMSPARILPGCIRKIIYSRLMNCLCFICGDQQPPPFPNAQNLHSISESMNDDEHPITEPVAHSSKQGDWQVLVKFVERCFFVLFMVFSIILCVVIDSDKLAYYLLEA